MEPQHLIPAAEFCVHYNIEVRFLHRLQDYGLLRVTTMDETLFIDADDVADAEKIMHLHQDLDINFEGIDVILQLLKRLEQTQAELTALRMKLRLHEDNSSTS